MLNRLGKLHLTETLPFVGTTRRNSAGQCTTGHSGSSCSPENNNRIHLWSAEDGIALFCSKYPGNAVPLPGASRNRDVARVVDTATRFQLSARRRTRSPGMHHRWNSDALLHCDRRRSEI